jgi:hypothetical protein
MASGYRAHTENGANNGSSQPMFQRNMLSPSSGLKDKPIKKSALSRQQTQFLYINIQTSKNI